MPEGKQLYERVQYFLDRASEEGWRSLVATPGLESIDLDLLDLLSDLASPTDHARVKTDLHQRRGTLAQPGPAKRFKIEPR